MGASHMSRRAFAALAGSAALLAAAPQAFAQQEFPVKGGKPIRIVVPFPAGGGTDAQARIVSQKLGELLGTTVIVDNRGGASTMLGASEVARSAPDGYTVLYAPSSTMAQNPHTLANVPYDPFKDFTPITLGGRGPLVLMVSGEVPASNVKELVAYMKANAGKVSYATFGAGTSSHIYGEMFLKKTGTEAVHVPYKGGSDAAKDLIGGRVQLFFDSAASAIITASGGKARIIAIASDSRIAAMPEVPTLAEQGVTGLDLPSWLGFYGPAKMPPAVVKTLHDGIAKVLAMPDVKEFYRKGGYEAGAMSPEDFAKLTRVTYDRWGTVIQQLGMAKQ
ncbi:Bug family tripartite tricarboxylate transporter substrate binding protein [Caenimonas terrae]|uniref:Bug family tripartite tricarboxylate transporter substrate binding protein n=1 Tax=Caenimonas terrae TaxID=696074 RepID=A0ABW0N5M1_9BURK